VGPSLLLASNSPRRRELLTEAGFKFEIWSPEIAEKSDSELTVRELTAFNAVRKAMAAARSHPKSIVLAADTLVAIDDKVLGKPDDMAHAVRMLERLSGQTHEVCTSVFICQLPSGRSIGFSEISRVRFRQLSRAQIDRYFARINPLDKAGAYAAQGFGADIIEKIDGSFTNVVGLPMEKTVAALGEFGIQSQAAGQSA
jgi:septum formation protein